MNIFKHCTTVEHHAHKCPNCELVWDHDPSTIASRRAFQDSHSCPRCGTNQSHVYGGDQSSLCCHNGVITEFYSGGVGPHMTARTRILHEIADRMASTLGEDLADMSEAQVAEGKVRLRIVLSLCDLTSTKLDFERLLHSSEDEFVCDVAGLVRDFDLAAQRMVGGFVPHCAREGKI